MVEVIEKAICPSEVIAKVQSDSSGCVVTYVGLIRDNSHSKRVIYVEYQDSKGNAQKALQGIAEGAKKKWKLENIAISHRIGRLKVGEINLVVAVASVHRIEGFAACQYVIDQFKENLPTSKIETYEDGSIMVNEVSQRIRK
ncbi:molybdenum cofactor biosynthesis protein MoaE [Chloroflexota bacterium]